MTLAPRIRLEEVAKLYENHVALQPLNLSVLPGQFMVILGQSGSGKTTLLRLIAGLESPTQGRIYLNEEEVTRKPPSARDIAYAFQMVALYPHFNVEENVAFPLRAQGVTATVAKQRARELLIRLGMGALLDRKPKFLSGGDQQRASLARALIRSPKAFLLDEPFGNLDGALREEMRDTLKVIHNERGSTTVLVTHDQVEAMALADYLAVIRDGQWIQAGTPRQLYEDPINMFVASFLGGRGMNLLPGIRRGEWVMLKDLPLRLRVGGFYGSGKKSVGEGAACFVGVRPEHVLLSEEGAPCFAEYTEILGAYNLLEAKASNAVIRVWLPVSQRFGMGEEVKLTFIPAGCRWFDGDSGAALPWKTLEANCQSMR